MDRRSSYVVVSKCVMKLMKPAGMKPPCSVRVVVLRATCSCAAMREARPQHKQT